MKQTREQLVVEMAKLLQANVELKAVDQERRKDFARAFGMFEMRGAFGMSQYKQELQTISWTDIFVELGKLLAMKDFRNLEIDVREHRKQIGEINKKMGVLYPDNAA